MNLEEDHNQGIIDVQLVLLCVWVLPFFLPVDIQHNQCPRYMFCGHKATPQRYYVATYRYAVSTAVGNAMPCHHTTLLYSINSRYDRHNKHILWKRETKESNQRENKNKAKEKKDEKQKKTILIEETICGAVGGTSDLSLFILIPNGTDYRVRKVLLIHRQHTASTLHTNAFLSHQNVSMATKGTSTLQRTNLTSQASPTSLLASPGMPQ